MGNKQRRAAAEAAADIAGVRKKSLTITGIKSDRTHPPSRKNKNRAIRAPPTMYSVEASRRNWRKTATDGDRGRGGRRPWLACFFVVGVYRTL
mgnify:CR=1 FL=1